MARTLLVAEDSTTIRKAVELTFLGEDVTVVCVDSPSAALAKARELRPDLVIVDSSLPDGGGYALCSTIKSDAQTGAPPVLLLTSSRHPFDGEKARQAGVDDSCDKPFESRVLLEKAAGLFGKPKAEAPYRAPAIVPPPAPPAAAAVPPPPAAAVPPPPPPAALAAAPPPAAAPKPAAPKPPPAAVAPTPAPPAAPPAALVGPPSAHAPVVASPGPKPVMTKPEIPSKLLEEASAAPAKRPEAAKAALAGLTAEQVEAVTKLAREVVERVVWEVVPDLAETIIKEEIARLTKE